MDNRIFIVMGFTFALLVLSAIIGSIIGVAREGKTSAGMGTHAIVALSSTAAMLAVFYIDVNAGDFWRIPAAIIGGIGFIGAGVMWNDEDGIKHGLTTAATILATSIVGIIIGLSLDSSVYTFDDGFAYVNLKMLFLSFAYPIIMYYVFVIRRKRRNKLESLKDKVKAAKEKIIERKRIVSQKEQTLKLEAELKKLKEEQAALAHHSKENIKGIKKEIKTEKKLELQEKKSVKKEK